jgi:hypothetical protein
VALTDIIDGVGEVAAVAVSADRYDFGAPTQKPSVLPWVAVTWSTSTPEARTYNYRDPIDGRLKARGKSNKHIGIGYAILSNSADVAQEDRYIVEAAAQLIGAFQDDTTLMGTGNVDRVARCRVMNIDRFRADWEGVVYAGLQFEWEAIEL